MMAAPPTATRAAMPIELPREARQQAIASIERWFAENRDEKIGNVRRRRAARLLPRGDRSRASTTAPSPTCRSGSRNASPRSTSRYRKTSSATGANTTRRRAGGDRPRISGAEDVHDACSTSGSSSMRTAGSVSSRWPSWHSARSMPRMPMRRSKRPCAGLDLAEADAVLRADFDAVEKLWARDMTVNNPFNQVVRSSGGRVRTGAVTYASFVRNIESIQVHGGHRDRDGQRGRRAERKVGRRRHDHPAALHEHLDEARRGVAADGAPRERHLLELIAQREPASKSSIGATATTPATARATSASSVTKASALQAREGDVLGHEGVVPAELFGELPGQALQHGGRRAAGSAAHGGGRGGAQPACARAGRAGPRRTASPAPAIESSVGASRRCGSGIRDPRSARTSADIGADHVSRHGRSPGPSCRAPGSASRPW